MARFYHWTDTGSPGRSLSGTAVNRLKTILLACLVYGYADKPAAGWSLVHEASGGFSLQNATGTGIINFSDWSTTAAYGSVKVTLLETITGGTSSAIPTGDNLRSGNGAPGSTPHGLPLYALYNNVSTAVWTVVADERSFCVYVAALAMDYSNAGSYTYNRSALLMAGEDSNGLFYAHGGMLESNSSGILTVGSGQTTGYTALRALDTGLMISGAGSAVSLGAFNSGGAGSVLADQVGDFPLVRAPLWYGSTLVGYPRGLVGSIHHYGINDSGAMALLGLSASADNRGKPVTLDGITLASVSGDLISHRRLFLTDHPDYW